MQNINAFTHPYIHTLSKLKFCAENMTADMVNIRDIVPGLGKECRFAKQIREDIFYSVAQHSMLITESIPLPDHLKIYPLMHDAAEAYVGDMPKPFKMKLPDYERLEGEIMAVICEHFGLQWPFPDGVRELVKEYDSRILVDEAAQLFDDVPEWLQDFHAHGIRPLGLAIYPVNWDEAMERFRHSFAYYYDLFLDHKGDTEHVLFSGC